MVYTDYWDKNQFKENLQLLWKISNSVFKNNKKITFTRLDFLTNLFSELYISL